MTHGRTVRTIRQVTQGGKTAIEAYKKCHEILAKERHKVIGEILFEYIEPDDEERAPFLRGSGTLRVVAEG